MRDRAECEAVVRQMWGYIDNVIPAEERQVVSTHVAACVDCAAHFEFAAEFLRALATAGERHTASAALRDRVAQALLSERSRKG